MWQEVFDNDVKVRAACAGVSSASTQADTLVCSGVHALGLVGVTL